MNHTKERPIDSNWTTIVQEATDDLDISAAEVNALLSRLQVREITSELHPYLAAAAAELLHIVDVDARLPVGDAPVALLRLIAKVALIEPTATGIHTRRLGEQLRRTFV